MKQVALAIALLLSLPAVAQEFGRASGGELSLMTKSPSGFSGSLGASYSLGRKGYGGSVSGSMFKDRLWFFGAAEQFQNPRVSTTLPQLALNTSMNTSLNTQLGDRNTLGASFRTMPSFNTTIPSTFLSLRYTGMLSSSSYVTFSAAQTK
jgi:hypothetical protein